jgi:hypothetical protein
MFLILIRAHSTYHHTNTYSGEQTRSKRVIRNVTTVKEVANYQSSNRISFSGKKTHKLKQQESSDPA